MNIVISTFGVRGDVQPYLALAVGLQGAGHRVTLATSDNFTAWIEAYGVRTHPTSFNLQTFIQQPETQRILKSRNVVRQVGLMRAAMHQNVITSGAVWPAMQAADFVI
jgi:sterol 3beta-glucosyltransferase